DLHHVAAVVEQLALEADAHLGLVAELADVAGEVAYLRLVVRRRRVRAAEDDATGPAAEDHRSAAEQTARPGTAGGDVDLLLRGDEAEVDDGVLHHVAVILQHVQHRFHHQLVVGRVERAGLILAHLELRLRRGHARRAARRAGDRGQQQQRTAASLYTGH